ncbi:uncharacterized protein [Nicotiana tomentosiformis]|uniref:uncharacterized protein n=1 Tax=Nicotiana tomentosiformis TaxID=4098 RepID=UPI00388CC276
MYGDNDNVDLVAREAVQLREKATRDAEEATLRDSQIAYEEERARRMAQNLPVGADEFGNIAPGQGRPLGDYARPVYNQGLSSVRPPPVAANNFELKQGLLQTLQNSCVFREKMNEDPNNHLMDFEEIMNTFQYNVEGPLMKKTPEEIVTILDELFEDANQWPYEFTERRRSNGVHQVDANTSVQVQLDAMAKEIRKLTLFSIQSENHATCDICGRGYPTHECQASTEEVNDVGNYNFNAMGQKHPDISWSSPGGTTNAWQQNNSRFQELLVLGISRGHSFNLNNQFSLGTLPADTEKNPKETVNAVTLRSGQVLKDPTPIHKEAALEKESGEELKIEDDKKTEKKKCKKEAEKKKKEKNSIRDESDDMSKHMPALPFPQKLYRENIDKQFERFLDMLKQVNVNLPFTEFLSQMPVYAKFLKEILTKKKKIEETLVVKLTEYCNAILQNKLPQKCGDHELVDQTTIIPEGIVEDILVQVDKFVFPVDFIVVKMEENKEVPLILGRPFLATSREILDIHDRKLILRVGDEVVTFEMNVEMG